MLFAAAGLLFMAFVALAFVGLTEARVGVRRLERQLQERSEVLNNTLSLPGEPTDREAEALANARFSSSLLALSKVQLQAKHTSPEPVHDESSSLVSVRLPQSKNHAPVS